jgi:hypothetical protein
MSLDYFRRPRSSTGGSSMAQSLTGTTPFRPNEEAPLNRGLWVIKMLERRMSRCTPLHCVPCRLSEGFSGRDRCHARVLAGCGSERCPCAGDWPCRFRLGKAFGPGPRYGFLIPVAVSIGFTRLPGHQAAPLNQKECAHSMHAPVRWQALSYARSAVGTRGQSLG